MPQLNEAFAEAGRGVLKAAEPEPGWVVNDGLHLRGLRPQAESSRSGNWSRVFRFCGQTRWSSAFRLFRAENMLKHELQPLTFAEEKTMVIGRGDATGIETT